MAPAPYSPIMDEIAAATNLSERSERGRLSPSAVQAFLSIVACWNVREEDARVLLGGIASEEYDSLRSKLQRALDIDTLTRISYLVGIFKALNSVYGEKLANEWLHLSNSIRP